jgi:hypothetical protein
MATYDRYTQFRINGDVKILPFINIAEKSSDKYFKYKKGITRFDNSLSNYYYGDPNYGWLILLGNASLAALEFEIEDGTDIRIPFPLETSLQQYINEVNKYDQYYGIS